ncbi:SPRY domain-containing protein 7 [Trichoplax sp. H2]|uniref:SPRY domain-containing protein 7 n=1 Tax=Trichoplax adhaerens TaxID=10228 RepID=B3RIF2_TRIAD|nr:hypothetical protein TRIADDRAFT_49551 [Trichoplax adhaerens]EDV28407.1 hypothetical protein TRIADDRAFT_49551 [Trichoplax adhaerens]RDD40893.1 SPRY domain-containing protein 7 [Trichoplax sp. H2]|eukprot:XP_002107609.1 hypothetical protein TRIADDRAFT_49551 [Trichoplax adhaerens]
MDATQTITSVFCNCFQIGIGQRPAQTEPQNKVALDTKRMGSNCVIVKSGRRICGSGGCLANSPIAQNKGYFEIKVQSTGIWGFGVAFKDCNLDEIPLGNDSKSWVYTSSGNILHDGTAKYSNLKKAEEGDVMACTYDHVELNFYLNGDNLQAPVTGFKGTVFPVIYVDKSAILDVSFCDKFYYPPPVGFEGIMMEHSII